VNFVGAGPRRAEHEHDRDDRHRELKGFMAAHNGAIMTVLLLVLGGKLIGDAIAGLSS